MLEYSSLSAYEKVTYVFLYICILMAILGISGNVCSFVILMRKKFKGHSFAFYLRINNITDTFVMLTSFRHFSAFVLQADLTVVADLICRLGEYSVHVASLISTCNLLLITIDLFVNTVHPQRFPIFKKRYFQIILVTLVTVYSVCFYVPLSAYFSLKTWNGTDKLTNETFLDKACLLTSGYSLLVDWSDLVNMIIISFILNNIFTILFIVSVHKSRMKFVTSGKMTAIALKDRKFAVNSIALNISRFFCKIKVSIVFITSAYLTLEPQITYMLFVIGISIYTLENSNTFFINCLFNSLFYQEFKKVFSLRFLKKGMFK